MGSRILTAILLSLVCLPAADGISVGQWNGMLVVSAPANGGLRALGGRLDQRITLDARAQPLEETVAFLRQTTGLNMVISPALLAHAPPVDLQVTAMSLGNLLHWLERSCSIHIGFVHGAVYFSDQPIADAMVTRFYDVADLGMTVQDFPGPSLSIPEPGGQGSRLTPPLDASTDNRPRYDLDTLTDLINRFIAR